MQELEYSLYRGRSQPLIRQSVDKLLDDVLPQCFEPIMPDSRFDVVLHLHRIGDIGGGLHKPLFALWHIVVQPLTEGHFSWVGDKPLAVSKETPFSRGTWSVTSPDVVVRSRL